MNENQNIILKHSIFSCLQQGKPSFYQEAVGGGGCRYSTKERDGNVLKCAVGHLMHESCYNQTIENADIYDSNVIDILKKSASIIFDDNFTEEYTVDLLSWLAVIQKCHDRFARAHAREHMDDSQWLDRFKVELYEYPIFSEFLIEWDNQKLVCGIT
jgi:hypothetical protein